MQNTIENSDLLYVLSEEEGERLMRLAINMAEIIRIILERNALLKNPDIAFQSEEIEFFKECYEIGNK